MNTLSGVSVSVVTFYQHAMIALDPNKPVTKLYRHVVNIVITAEKLGVVQFNTTKWK